MCGLVGVAGEIGLTEEKVFKQLLYVDGLRGMHSTGVMAVDKLTGDTNVWKSKDSPENFTKTTDYASLTRNKLSVLMGHNRYATKGSINGYNAHPFVKGSYVGAHNGTLTNQNALPDSGSFVVDSENLIYSVNKIGLLETYRLIEGAWALSLYNKDTSELSFIRNDERPLHFCYSKDRKTLFWASEGEMLTLILTRNKIEYTDIVSLKEHQLYSFVLENDGKPLNNFSIKDFSKERPKPKKENLIIGNEVEFVVDKLNTYANFTSIEGTILSEPFHKVSVYQVSLDGIEVNDIMKGEVNYWNGSRKDYVISSDSLRFVFESSSEEEDDESVYLGYEGTILTQKEWDEKTKNGCCWCTANIIDDESCEWVGSNAVLCDDCANSTEVTNSLRM